MTKIRCRKCVMCDEEPIEYTNGEKRIQIFWLAPKTGESLCEKCNIINDSILFDKGNNQKGQKYTREIKFKP